MVPKLLTKDKKIEEFRVKNEIKYCSLVAFGNYINQILDDCHFIVAEHKRQPVEDLSGLQRLALSIILMDHCNFRVGNLKHNKKSTGLLTIETSQYYPADQTIAFLGKKRVLNQCYIENPRLNTDIMELWREVDGYPANQKGKRFLFRFDGGAHRVNADDLNDFLKIYHSDFSAKMFRTWKANLIFLEELNGLELPISQKDVVQNIKEAVQNVAGRLYHTPAICRRSYIDNRILELYRNKPELFHSSVQQDYQGQLINLFQSFC